MENLPTGFLTGRDVTICFRSTTNRNFSINAKLILKVLTILESVIDSSGLFSVLQAT